MSNNFLRHFLEYKLSPQVKHLILHVTRRCNLKCKSCFVDTATEASDELSLNEIRTLSSYFKNLCFLDIGGGEPFLREDLAEICQLFEADHIGIPTNGILKDTILGTALEIKRRIKGRLMISISLDGFEPTNDFIRSRGHFRQALTTYEDLRKIKDISLKINTVLCNNNIQELGPFIKFVRKLSPDFHSIIFIRGNPRDGKLELPSIQELADVEKLILKNARFYINKSDFLKNLFFKRYYTFLIKKSIETLKYNKAAFRCLAGRAHCVVYPEGDVSFCELLSPIGNIRKECFKSIWNSDKAEKEREKIRDKLCYCTHNCVMLDSFIFNLPFSLL